MNNVRTDLEIRQMGPLTLEDVNEAERDNIQIPLLEKRRQIFHVNIELYQH